MKVTRTPRTLLLAVLLAAAAGAAACNATPSRGPVRDVRPTTLEAGEKLIVETSVPLAAGAPTTVVLEGTFAVPGREPARRRVTLPARATAPAGAERSTRVLADVTDALEEQLGGHAAFRGGLVVSQGGRAVAATDGLSLDLFPKTLRGVARDAARSGFLKDLPAGVVYGGVAFLVGLVPLLLAMVFGGFTTVWERKLSGYMQSRYGPNRVGPNGWLQWVADGLKLVLKEDLIPAAADRKLFLFSPYFVWMGVFGTFLVLPFSQVTIFSDLNIGILYLLSVTALVVVGIIMGGWSSNSKWSLLGGMRSAAQIVSYEIPASLSIMTVVALTGTLSMQGIVGNQGGSPWNWHVFDNPFTFICFFVWFFSALAEGNRTPFDLPEAESELVSGYNTEYSGFRFAVFALSEWVNLVVIGAVATAVFLGGWRIPGVSPAQIEASGPLQLVSLAVFAVKTIVMVFAVIWMRWTLPRFRIDHMMNLCWKYFLPIALCCLVAVAGWMWIAPFPSTLRIAGRWFTFVVGGLGLTGFFAWRVYYTATRTRLLQLRGA